MLRRTYDWVMARSGSPHAARWLAGLAFIEGIFFPVPPDVLLMPLVLSRRERAWRFALICLVASVLGGSIGYAIGYFLAPVGVWLIRFTGGDPISFHHWYGEWGVLLLALPIPYKITAIASGMFRLRFWIFIVASIFIRGIRFFAVAGLMRAYGEPIRAFIETRLVLVTSVVALAVIGVIAALRLLH
ncbi:MAG TPA: YqaA family protein [Caulobacteraceae bacterium]|nr:YqaA family protein [Caulobacteraceae bacterium]